MHPNRSGAILTALTAPVDMSRYYAFSAYLRQRFGRRVQKIPLDAGASCPNREGPARLGGCLFCNARGSGTGLWDQGLSLSDQWLRWREHYGRKYKNPLFLAYLQSFSNTHGPVERLGATLDAVLALPEVAGLAVGTRPDCLDPGKLALLSAAPFDELWIELGLPSAKDATLRAVNRGSDFAAFAKAARDIAALAPTRRPRRAVKLCAHIMAGLPGETKDDFLHTIDAVNALPVHGVKIHNLYVARGSRLADLHAQGAYDPLPRDAYLDWLGAGLARLRPDIVVERLWGDPAPGELLAPEWAADRRGMAAAVKAHLEAKDIRQGRDQSGLSGPQPWFSPLAALPETLHD